MTPARTKPYDVPTVYWADNAGPPLPAPVRRAVVLPAVVLRVMCRDSIIVAWVSRAGTAVSLHTWN